MMKYCYRCKESKPILSFVKNKSKKDGLSTECRECKRTQDKSHYQANSEKIKQSVAKYRSENPEKVIQVKKDWYQANSESTKEKVRIYRKDNRGKCNALSKKYKADKIKATPKWAELDKISIVYQKAKEWGFVVDHIVPLQGKTVCGLHCWSNLQLLDPEINARKSNVYWVDMP